MEIELGLGLHWLEIYKLRIPGAYVLLTNALILTNAHDPFCLWS